MEDFLNQLKPEEYRFLTYKKIKKCEIIHHEEEMCDLIGFVIQGKLAIISYTFKGKEIIYNEINPGQIYGNNLIFSSSPYYKGDVIAKVDSYIAQIKKEDLIYLLQSNKNFLLAYLNIQSNFSKSLNTKIKLLNFESPEDRFMYYLSIHQDKIKIESITDFAKQLNIARETLSRLIKKLAKENKIEYQNKTIVKLG